ncbi:MAG: hypothetical protein QNL28_08145 [Flavobacteriaceae bacterium]|tara:strand:- start:1311 stop:1955 length:645 start_codon:yes stop_codon:yes gene_type:complete
MKTLFYLLSLILSIQFSTAQTQSEIERSKSELNGTIKQQYEFILLKGENYQTNSVSYKVIKNMYLQAFKEHLNDSLLMIENKFTVLEVDYVKLLNQNDFNIKRIETLKGENQKINTAKKTIPFLWTQISQIYFLWIFWMSLFVLLYLVIFLVRKYLIFKVVQTKSLLEKNTAIDQLNDFRKKALVREQKLSRKILDLEKIVPNKKILSQKTGSS